MSKSHKREDDARDRIIKKYGSFTFAILDAEDLQNVVDILDRPNSMSEKLQERRRIAYYRAVQMNLLSTIPPTWNPDGTYTRRKVHTQPTFYTVDGPVDAEQKNRAIKLIKARADLAAVKATPKHRERTVKRLETLIGHLERECVITS